MLTPSTQPNDEVNVVLVHGTWAEKAAWCNDDAGAIRVAMRETFPDLHLNFHAHDWSGDNKHLHRIEAGKRLSDELTELTNKCGAQCVVVGHSHGGAVISHALRASPELGGKLLGAIFLSTPFIQMRLRPGRKYIKHFLFGLLLIGLTLTLVALPYFLIALLPQNIGLSRLPQWLGTLLFVGALAAGVGLATIAWHLPPPEGWMQKTKTVLISAVPSTAFLVILIVAKELFASIGWVALLSWGAASLSAILGFILVLVLFPRISSRSAETVSGSSRIDGAITNFLHEFSTESLKHAQCLFIRGNRDEAAAGLGMVYVFSKLINTLVTFALWCFAFLVAPNWWNPRAVWKSLNTTAKCIALLLTVAVVGPFAVGLLVAILFIVPWVILNMIGFDADAALKSVHEAFNTLLNLRPFVLSFKFVEVLEQFLLVVEALAAIVTLVAAVALLVLGRAFGHWFVWTSLFFEVSIEAVPPGTWQIVQLADEDNDTNEGRLKFGTLAHSMTYQDPRAVKLIVDWIGGRLRSDKATELFSGSR